MSNETLREFRPTTTVDWTKIVLSLLLAVFTLMVGRVWGEAALAAEVTRNTVRLSVMERRLDDHLQAANQAYSRIETDLREIRRAVGAGER